MKHVKFGENLCCFSKIAGANPGELQFIADNYVKEKISFVDFINNKTITAPRFDYEDHDVLYTNGFFIYVQESEINIFKNNKLTASIKAGAERCFARACYYTKDCIHYLAVASHSFFNLEEGKLTVYEILTLNS